MNPIYTLTPGEVMLATIIGTARNDVANDLGRKPRFAEKVPGELMKNHINGAKAELAFCRIMNVEWDASIDRFRNQPDVTIGGISIEVRYSPLEYLKVKENDFDVIVAAMTGKDNVFEFKGWFSVIGARLLFEARSPRRDAPPAFFVPWKSLHSPQSLEPLLELDRDRLEERIAMMEESTWKEWYETKT